MPAVFCCVRTGLILGRDEQADHRKSVLCLTFLMGRCCTA